MRSASGAGSGACGPGSQPGSRGPRGTARPALRPVCEELRWTRERGAWVMPCTQTFPEARPPGQKRRGGAPEGDPRLSHGRGPRLNSANCKLRRPGAPPPFGRHGKKRTQLGRSCRRRGRTIGTDHVETSMRPTPDWLTAPLNPTSYRDDFWIPWQLERLAGHADIDRDIDERPRAAARECRRSQCRRARTCQKGK
jgi:hypothetical protein